MSVTCLLYLATTACTPTVDKGLAEAEKTYQEKNYNQAITLSKAILQKNPGSLKALRLKALSYIALNDIQAALDDYEGLDTDHPDIAPQLLEEILIGIIKDALQQKSFFVRSAAIKALAEMGDPAYLHLIIPRMKDEVAFVRFFTVESLGQLEGPDTLKLVMAAGNDPDGMVRIGAIKVLDESEEGEGDSVRLNNLLATFVDDADVTVRLFALAAMSKHGDKEAFSKMIDAIKKLPADTLSSGIAALGKSKNLSAVPYLNTFITADNQSLRMLAAESMGEIPAPEFYPSLQKALQDASPSVRASAATSLGKLGDKNAIPLLENQLQDPKSIVRVSAAEGLKRLGRNKLEVYNAALSDPDYGVRHFTISSLRRNWGMDAMPLLKASLKDETPRVRTAAIRAIGEIGGKESLPVLKEMLKDPDLAVRTYAAGNVGRILNKMAGKKLKKSEH